MTETKTKKASKRGGCSTGGGCSGCSSKLNVFDWLKETPPGVDSQDIIEVRFKSTNKEFFLNDNKINLVAGDIIAVEAISGHDIGTVSATGEIVLKQLKKKRISSRKEFKKVYRKARETDIEKWETAIEREESVMLKARKIATDLGLNMKIGDVEFQGDGSKAIFYYIADKRVDFRELIRVLATEFRIRIEMKQIGARQEAGRIGGIGSCGRELCCSSWKTDFDSVSTDAARLQEIGLNPQKLTGQCGKLKCCINFEIDNYIDALKNFPQKRSLESKEGRASFVKQDILQGTMLYTLEKNNLKTYVTLGIERVKQIQALNLAGDIPEKLLEVDDSLILEEIGFKNDVGEDSLTRFDKVNTNKRKSRRKKPSGGQNKANHNTNNTKETPKTSNRNRPNKRKENPNAKPPTNKSNTKQNPRKTAQKTQNKKTNEQLDKKNVDPKSTAPKNTSPKAKPKRRPKKKYSPNKRDENKKTD